MEGNEIRVDCAGSKFTPYQILFSYALPWEGRTPSPQIDVNLRAPSAAVNLGAGAALRIDVRNLLGGPLNSAYVELRVPPLLRLEPPPDALVSGSTAPGTVALLAVRSILGAGTRTLDIPVTAVAAGRAYIQPCAAFLAPGAERAHSEPGFIDIGR